MKLTTLLFLGSSLVCFGQGNIQITPVVGTGAALDTNQIVNLVVVTVISTNSTLDTNHQLSATGSGSSDVNGIYTFKAKVGISYNFTNASADVIHINGSAFTTAGTISNNAATSLFTWTGAVTNGTFTTTGGTPPAPTITVVSTYTTNAATFYYASNNLYLIPTNNSLFVAPWGNDTLGSITNGMPYFTIMAAQSNAVAGQTIFIWPGSYTNGQLDLTDVKLIGLGSRDSVVIGQPFGTAALTQLTNNVTLQNLTFRGPIYFNGTSNTLINCMLNCYDGVDCIVDGGISFDWCRAYNSDFISGYDTVNLGATSKFHIGHFDFFNCRALADGGSANFARCIVSGSAQIIWTGGSLTASNGTVTAAIVMGGNNNGETNSTVTIGGGVQITAVTTNGNTPYQAYWQDTTTNMTLVEYGPLINNYNLNGQNGAILSNALGSVNYMAGLNKTNLPVQITNSTGGRAIVIIPKAFMTGVGLMTITNVTSGLMLGSIQLSAGWTNNLGPWSLGPNDRIIVNVESGVGGITTNYWQEN